MKMDISEQFLTIHWLKLTRNNRNELIMKIIELFAVLKCWNQSIQSVNWDSHQPQNFSFSVFYTKWTTVKETALLQLNDVNETQSASLSHLLVFSLCPALCVHKHYDGGAARCAAPLPAVPPWPPAQSAYWASWIIAPFSPLCSPSARSRSVTLPQTADTNPQHTHTHTVIYIEALRLDQDTHWGWRGGRKGRYISRKQTHTRQS